MTQLTTRILSVGPLAFTALEAGTGPLAILLHGFPDGPETFSNQIIALAGAGFHAVAVTLRGYESSSRPADRSFRLVDLATDVIGWIDALGERRAHLVGHDWGATIAFATAVSRPERITTLTMLAVPPLLRLAAAILTDPVQRKRSRYMFFFQLYGLADWRLRRQHAALVERLWRKWSPSWQIPPGAVERVRDRFSQKQVSRSALSYYRQTVDIWSKRGRASWALLKKPVLAPTLGICGEQDNCVGADVFVSGLRSSDFRTSVQSHVIAGAGHFVHLEKPEAVNALLLFHLAYQSQ